jgi:serine protease inhibitor
MGASQSNYKVSSAEMALKIFEQELKEAEENFAFSPLSVETALSMITLGSKGASKVQLLNFIGHGKDTDLDGIMKNLGTITESFQNKDSSIIWDFHNVAFLQEDCDLKDDYKNKLEMHLGAVVKSVDFDNYPKAARLINDFVKEKTHEKITKIVERDELQDATLALVNVLYFNGLWREPFDSRLTSKSDFYVNKTKTVQADFMTKTSRVLMGKFEGRDVVALPYVGDRFVMFLIVPDKNKDELHMKPEDIVNSLKHTKFRVKMTDLTLPKFKITWQMNLEERLKKFGVHDIFDGSVADLSGISDCTKPRPLYVSRIQHKVYLKVNEKGTEAAAVTSVNMTTRSGAIVEARAHFDRPFTFMLKDEQTDTVIFMGRVLDPTQ